MIEIETELPDELLARAERFAAQHGLSLSEVAAIALERYLGDTTKPAGDGQESAQRSE